MYCRLCSHASPLLSVLVNSNVFCIFIVYVYLSIYMYWYLVLRCRCQWIPSTDESASTLVYSNMAPLFMIQVNRSLLSTTTKPASGQTSKQSGPSWSAGFRATTWHRSTAWTNSAGTMARFHAVPLSTYWAAALTAASWCGRVKVVRVRGRCLYATKAESITTVSMKTRRDRCVCVNSRCCMNFFIVRVLVL